MELKRNDMYTTDGALMKIIELWRYSIAEKQMKEQSIHGKKSYEICSCISLTSIPKK